MEDKTFHILLQNGSLYKNVKVPFASGYASTSGEVYYMLDRLGYIIMVRENKEEAKKIYKNDIYYICLSEKY